MKFFLPHNWDDDFENDGALYFVQRLEEMLFDYSIDLYRMPLLNTHGLAEEYCDVWNKVDLNEVKEYQRDIVFEEFLYSLKNDIVLKECWGVENVEKVIKTFGSSSKKEVYNTISYLNAIFSSGQYFEWCEKTVVKYISMPKEKKKLEATIRCYISELVFMGYDTHYVYSELKKFFSKSNVNRDTVKKFLSFFDFKRHEYKVYFSLSAIATKFKDILEHRLRLKFEDDGNFKYFKKDSNKIIVYFENVKALCPNSAAQRAYERLDLFFSFYKFVGNKKGFPVQKKAMVLEEKQAPIFVDAKKITYNIIEEINFEKIGATSERLLTGLLYNAESEYLLLSKAIELHNTALSVPDLKSGFLNFWASLEVLCQNIAAESKLDAVLKVVVPILKKDYLLQVVNEISEGLKDNIGEQDYKKILENITEVGCDKKKMFYFLFLPKYDENRKEVIKKVLTRYPVLRSRISILGDMRKNHKLKEFIDVYVERVTWHLYRMYRTRNAIIHSGEIPSNIKYLGEHLHAYVDSALSEFIVKLSGNIPFDSIENVIVDIKFSVANLDNIFVKNKEIDERVVDVLIHSEIGSKMHCEKHVVE